VRIWKTDKTSLAVGTSIYAQGDALGTKQSVAVPHNGIIRGIVITDVDDEASVTVNVWMFESEPAGIAANAAFALADADLEKVFAVHLVDSDFDGINGIAKFEQTAVPYHQTDGALYFQCELEDSATPTFAATTDVKIQFFIEW
jgi:hypothetical protein